MKKIIPFLFLLSGCTVSLAPSKEIARDREQRKFARFKTPPKEKMIFDLAMFGAVAGGLQVGKDIKAKKK